MVVCGDDGLARRLAAELQDVYREPVTLVVPAAREPQPAVGRRTGRGLGLLARVPVAQPRRAAAERGPLRDLRLVEAAEPDENVLAAAGVARAAALALVYEDDETNVRAALVARRLNPRLRLVIRLYNRRLGQHLEELLDQAAAIAEPGLDLRQLDASTTVLSDADTAAPALAASAIAGTSKVVQADGLLLRAVERTPPGRGQVADSGLCTLALLSATTGDPAGAEGSEASGDGGPQLLPDDRAVAAATGRGSVALEAVSRMAGARAGASARLSGATLPVGSLFSRRLRWALAGIAAAVTALAVASWVTTGDHPLHAAYIILLDIFAINDPALQEPPERKTLQILAGTVGLLLLPVLVEQLLQGRLVRGPLRTDGLGDLDDVLDGLVDADEERDPDVGADVVLADQTVPAGPGDLDGLHRDVHDLGLVQYGQHDLPSEGHVDLPHLGDDQGLALLDLAEQPGHDKQRGDRDDENDDDERAEAQ